jgi:hypothetical protein
MSFRIVIGFDVQRDGAFVELARVLPDGVPPVLDAFQADGQSAITITGWEDFDCPADEIQRSMRTVEERLGPGAVLLTRAAPLPDEEV